MFSSHGFSALPFRPGGTPPAGPQAPTALAATSTAGVQPQRWGYTSPRSYEPQATSLLPAAAAAVRFQPEHLERPATASKDSCGSREEAQKPGDVDLVDVDEQEENENLKEEEAHDDEQQREQDDDRFTLVFNKAAKGECVPLDQLPSLLAEVLPDTAEADIQAAVGRVLGHLRDTQSAVGLEDALAVLHYLTMEARAEAAALMEDKSGCLGRWADRMSDAKATNVLLVIVVLVSMISAFLAAGLGILFMWNTTFALINVQLIEDVGTVRDVIDVFQENIFQNEINTRVLALSTIVSTVTDLVSYKSTLDYNMKNLEYMVTFMAEAVAAWWQFVPEKGYTNMARVMALWLDAAITSEGRNASFDMVNKMEQLLPPGFEILLGEFTDATNTSIRYLTNFRFADQCVNHTCASDDAVGNSPMRAAMLGAEGAMQAMDYRPHPVLVGYTSIDGIGVEYKSDLDIDQQTKFDRMRDFFNQENLNATDSHEFVLGQMGADGNPLVLTAQKSCDEVCLQYVTRSDGPLGLALAGQSGTMTLNLYTGDTVLAAYSPIPGTSLGLVYQMLKQEAVDIILASAVALVDWINANFSVGTEELELTLMTQVNGTKQFTHLSKRKFGDQCPNGVCLTTTPYLEQAAKNCSQGVMRTTDYRGTNVIAGYYCLADLDTYISMKMDEAEMQQELLSNVVEYINNRNILDLASSDEFFIAQAKAGVDPASITSVTQFNVLTALKHPELCLHPNCSWDAELLLRAIQNRPGDLPTTMTGFNYAGIPVTGALDFDPLVGGGIAMSMEMDTTQFMTKIISTAANVLYFTSAVVLVASVALVVLTKYMMRSMIAASDEGKRAVEHERQQFSTLVASMYPAYVVPRLLSGERHIVSHIKHTAVFFSDIFEFTSASNTITSEELIQFMGYTYGVMDNVADRFGVYKVKTVGDAYLAVAGLPGMPGSAVDRKGDTKNGTEGQECCLNMLRFASCIAQVFSHRFHHPDKGQILTVVAGTMSWNKRRKRVQVSTSKAGARKAGTAKGSVAPTSSVPDRQHPAWTASGHGPDTESVSHSVVSGAQSKATSHTTHTNRNSTPQVQCVMSYGVATGPITAGVLHGKNPMFDIWGKTVNLASRMESTSQPGRIQVAEHFFRKVAAIPGQPFQFEAGHKAYCKGFGAVNSYFVRSTNEAPPKDLMLQLGLEPRFGMFFFDNVVNGAQRNSNNCRVQASPSMKTGSCVSGDEHSSHVSGPAVASVAAAHPHGGQMEFESCSDA